MHITNFNLRVYGLLIHDGHVLITHEHRAGLDMTKFPGGGLEKGEGIEACLKREFLEEMNLEIQVDDFFYVNEFLQISTFNPSDQLLSFYYRVSADFADIGLIHDLVNREFIPEKTQKFDWVLLDNLNEEDFTFPIDRVVAKKLRESITP